MIVTRPLLVLIITFIGSSPVVGQQRDTLPLLQDGQSPKNFEEMWTGFDPRAEPLEIETLKKWEEDGVVLRIVRFRIGVFKNKKLRSLRSMDFQKVRLEVARNFLGWFRFTGAVNTLTTTHVC